jgi:hypothetical protein
MNPLAPLARPAAAFVLTSTLLLAGCVKPAEPKPPENKPAPQVEPFAAAPETPAKAPTLAGIPAAAIGAAERARARVEVASTATVDQGAFYKQAQALYAEKKFPEALAALNQIQPELLTRPQEKAVDELRAQINAGLGR